MTSTPCHGLTEFFYSFDPDQQATAKLICSTCPLREPCLIVAMKRDEPDGIWGGYDAEERRLLPLGRWCH